ncbi:sensor domain-containing diguanylate cyclase [Rhizorhabdus phycosphaerae]|uniref:sensor domain-containing diguanylate cyclase n=1 Tax=Rhizorhabdus phycosphaerae TaxID=2711156 RepID=UPI0013EB85D0|nr:diguanylate cyclase [Rhizorhabdus phycosphaerae]
MYRWGDGSSRREAIGALLGAAGYFLLAWGSTALTSGAYAFAVLWPANALLLALLIPVSPNRWPIFLAPAFLANMLANQFAFGTVVGASLYAMANLIEVAIAALILRRSNTGADPFTDVRTMLIFILLGGIGPVFGALVGALTANALYGTGFWIALRNWYLADATGLILFTPLFVGIGSGALWRWYDALGRRGRMEAVLILLIVGFVALVVFRHARNPMLFVMGAPLLLATFRLGPFGTKISFLLFAVLAIDLTMSGEGPIAKAYRDPLERATYLQIYLALMLLMTLPVAADLNARRLLARRLQESEASLRLLASSSADMLVRLDHRGRCVQASGNSALLPVRHGTDLLGNRLADLAEHADAPHVEASFSAAFVNPGEVSRCEFRPLGRPTEYLECTMRALIDGEGHSYGVVGAIRDVSLRKAREQSLALAASTDSLTGALNHAAFMCHLDRLLAALSSPNLALLMIDVDRFKKVNDSFGHLAGDRVLVELHDRLRTLLRDHDVIGRLGGDELAIILDGTSPELAMSIADALRIAVSRNPVVLPDGDTLIMSLSCGIAQARPGMTRHELIKRADEALYIAKNNGRDCVATHAP